MTQLQVFGLYFAIFALIQLFLTFRVVFARQSGRVPLGDNEDLNLRARIRSHANFTETVPIALIGLLALALLKTSTYLMHSLGVALIIGRLLHAHGMMQKNAIGQGRVFGMVLTLIVIALEAIAVLYICFF